MENETPGKGSTLILGRSFLMTAKTKIDVHARILSMEFGDILLQFNIFEAMKHPTEDHYLFGTDLIDELVEEYFQLDSHNEDIDNFAERTDPIEEADYAKSGEVHNLSDSADNNNDIADLDFEAELLEVLDQVCKHENPEYSIEAEKLSDLLGINPSICMHRILLEETTKPIRQQQRRMNLTILDMVKKEVTKLLVVGIIYSISDSE
ncbi:hypothetical protein CR513_19034, partial [Mucuna pruriens]